MDKYKIIQNRSDEIIKNNSQNVVLNADKSIRLIIDYMIESQNKKIVKNLSIRVDDILISSSIDKTVLFFAELRLFELVDKDCLFFEKVQHQKLSNLKLKSFDKNIYVSKIEAYAMCQIYHISKSGYSFVNSSVDEDAIAKRKIATILNSSN